MSSVWRISVCTYLLFSTVHGYMNDETHIRTSVLRGLKGDKKGKSRNKTGKKGKKDMKMGDGMMKEKMMENRKMMGRMNMMRSNVPSTPPTITGAPSTAPTNTGVPTISAFPSNALTTASPSASSVPTLVPTETIPDATLTPSVGPVDLSTFLPTAEATLAPSIRTTEPSMEDASTSETMPPSMQVTTAAPTISAGMGPGVQIPSTNVPQLLYLTTPEQEWMVGASPLGIGNSVTLSPDESILTVTCSDGDVRTFDSMSGESLWMYSPENRDEYLVFSFSGATYSSSMETGTYLVYAVTEALSQMEPASCRVIALAATTGELVWESNLFNGGCQGTPVVSQDGQHVFVTHNNATAGHFSILNSTGMVAFSYASDTKFSSVGIYHQPGGGNFPGGEDNTNDILVWASSSRFGGMEVENPMTFGFQFPINGSMDDLEVIELSAVSWTTKTAPKITNDGYSMYFSASESRFVAWNGAPGMSSTGFDQPETVLRTFPPGTIPSQAYYAPLALSSDRSTPMLFGGTSSNLFVGMKYDLEMLWEMTTSRPILAEAIVSPDDAVVYFAEDNGDVHCVNVTTGTQLWNHSIANLPIKSNFVLTSDGFFLFIGDTDGNIVKWRVAGDADSFSSAPSTSPEAPKTFAPMIPAPASDAPVTPVSLTPVPPSPDFPACSICGKGLKVTIPNAIVEIPGQPPATCQVLEIAGMEGFIDPDFCPLLPSLVGPCGCTPSMAAPSSPETEAPSISASEGPSMSASEGPSISATEAPSISATEAPSMSASEGPSISSSLAPSMSEREDPVSPPLPPSPGFPPCSFCGPGLRVTMPDVLVEVLGQTPIACVVFEIAGKEGFIDPQVCPLLPAFAVPCGCEPISS